MPYVLWKPKGGTPGHDVYEKAGLPILTHSIAKFISDDEAEYARHVRDLILFQDIELKTKKKIKIEEESAILVLDGEKE